MERTELHATGAMLPVYTEHINVSAHEFAEATEDAWHYTPLQTKDGFGRTVGDLWVVGDWLFSDFQMPPALYQIETCYLLDQESHVNPERFKWRLEGVV